MQIRKIIFQTIIIIKSFKKHELKLLIYEIGLKFQI